MNRHLTKVENQMLAQMVKTSPHLLEPSLALATKVRGFATEGLTVPLVNSGRACKFSRGSASISSL